MVIIVLEGLLVPLFVPTISIQTPQEDEYLLPWKYTCPKTLDSSIEIALEVHDLVFPERATPLVNDVIVYSFNITNLTNETLEINFRCNVVSPIFEFYGNRIIKLETGKTESIDREKVVLKNEGVNEIDLLFNITNRYENYKMEHYVWAISQQTENYLLFNKYGQILTLIVLIPSTIIAIKNLKDLVIKSNEKKR
ncbi:hypothetical protein MUP77_01150 [Candidatus Bathyarchaeota archaeon]|nr:hypothetical protein [Candidatus Bathyarchaeota archaeon]